MRTVMRLVLSFSLLIAFTTSAAAALCLQMEHTPGAMTGGVAAMDSPGYEDGAGTVLVLAGPKGAPAAHACCYQRASTPDALTPPQRAVPAEATDVLSVAIVQLPAGNGHPPSGLFDPALIKLDHLTPSLTKLSISRT